MVDIPSTPPTGPQAPQAPKPEDQVPDPGASYATKPQHWFGMDFTAKEANQLMNILNQSVVREIDKEKQKSIKAIRNFGKDEAEMED